MLSRRIVSRAIIIPADMIARDQDERPRARRPVRAHVETSASELDRRGAEAVPEPPPRIA